MMEIFADKKATEIDINKNSDGAKSMAEWIGPIYGAM